LNFDNAFPKRGYDLLTTSAYRLPNGNIQPSASMWAHREFLKRIWNIHQELGPKDIPPIMMIAPMPLGIRVQAARMKEAKRHQERRTPIRRSPWGANDVSAALPIVTSWARRFGDRLSLSELHPKANP